MIRYTNNTIKYGSVLMRACEYSVCVLWGKLLQLCAHDIHEMEYEIRVSILRTLHTLHYLLFLYIFVSAAI